MTKFGFWKDHELFSSSLTDSGTQEEACSMDTGVERPEWEADHQSSRTKV